MGREVRTDVLISAKTKGLAQAQQEITRITRENSKAIDAQVKGFASSGKAMKAVGKETKRLEDSLQTLAKRQLAINQLMGAAKDKGASSYRALADEMKNVEKEASRVQRTLQTLETAFGKTWAKKQGFMQGMGQGLAPGAMTFLQRGPGMKSQMMGAALGAGARGTARAAVGTATGGLFQGMQGVISGIQGIPGVGGMLAAPLQRMTQQAQQALEAQQVQLQTAPFLGGVALQRQARAAGRKAYGPAEQEAQEKVLARIGTPEMEKSARIRAHEQMLEVTGFRASQNAPKAATIGDKVKSALGLGEFAPIEKYKREIAERSKLKQDKDQLAFLTQDARKQVETEIRGEAAGAGKAAGKSASARARSRLLNQALGLGQGTGFGMDINAERQFRSSVQQAGGGYGTTAGERTLGTTAMAAQTAFGVGGGVSGAFSQAQRRGGLVGGGGAEALTGAISDAMKLGLEGSEIRDYLEEMASGINQWKSTGIPFNKDSMKSMTTELGTSLGSVRAGGVAKGFAGLGERMSMSGPQSGAEAAVFQALTGIGPGETDLKTLEDAMIRLEKKDFVPGGMEKAIEMLGGKEGAAGRMTAFGALQKMGIRMGREEFVGMMAGKPVSKEEEARRTAGGQMAPKTPEELIAQAKSLVPDAVRKQAEVTNQQIANGTTLVGTMKTLEQAAQNVTKAATDVLAPLLKIIGMNLEGISKMAERSVAGALAGDPSELTSGPQGG